MRLALIPGTWDDNPAGWHTPGSPFGRAMTEAGHTIVTLRSWNTRLDGIIGRNEDWIDGGRTLGLSLLNLQQSGLGIDAIIAWSHGGNVAAYALAFMRPSDLRVRHLITLGTPVRRDLRPFYDQAARAADHWTHIYGGSDWMQLFGAFGDGIIEWLRGIPGATNVFVPGAAHRDLLNPSRIIDALDSGATTEGNTL